MKNSPISWEWQHIKGHQDDYSGLLDRFATLNVEMDKRAKAKRSEDEANPPPIQHAIEGKMWR
eukprot:10133269-Ditylum_brightwellii.AAC.1